MVVTALFPCFIAAFYLLQSYQRMDEFAQDEIATYQLRRILLLSKERQIQGGDLIFTYQGKEMNANFKNEKILIQPGTQMVYTQIQEGNFVAEGGIISITYLRQGKNIKRVLVDE